MRHSSLSKYVYDTKVGGYAGWQGSLSEGPEQARMDWPEPPGAQQGQVWLSAKASHTPGSQQE